MKTCCYLPSRLVISAFIVADVDVLSLGTETEMSLSGMVFCLPLAAPIGRPSVIVLLLD